MPIILDTNCFVHVFVKSSAKHNEFKPVLDWIINGKGMLVYGGSKYKQELKKTKKFLTIFNLLKDSKKVYEGNSKNIDAIQAKIEKLNTDPDFDDPHLPAIVLDTKCRLICSLDKRSVVHVTDSKYYPKNFTKPVYYSSAANKELLSDNYIDERLKPLCKLNKVTSESLLKFVAKIKND